MSQTAAGMEQRSKEESQTTLLPLSDQKVEWLKSSIRDVPDFPKQGIIFKDLTTLLRNPESFGFVIDALVEKYAPLRPDFIAAIEARGFILGAPVAHRLGAGFVPIRKPGKLPHKVEREAYALEYGSDAIEIHADAIEDGKRVVLIDDVLATGGTASAAVKLLRTLGAKVVGVGFVVELAFLNGRKKLPKDVDMFALLSY